MAKAIREIGIKLIGWINRALAPKPSAGWQRSSRRADDLLSK